jgi:hypothetical protein
MPDINKAYSWAIETCNAPNVGYSQAYRNAQTVGGITYYDCSSFINYALLAGGFTTPNYAPKYNAFTTYTEADVLLSLGFKEVDASGEYLPGDIGLSVSHTEMCYKGGKGKGVFMGAHTDNAPLEYQVSIGSTTGNQNYETSFPRLFRYGEGGATGYGCSAYVVSAICGNMWQESGVNPGMWEGQNVSSFTALNVGFGLGQWTNTGGDTHGRLYKLHEWLQENGYQDDDGVGQLNYLIHENVWYSRDEASQYATLTDFLTSSSTDLAELTHAFNVGWEGIHDHTWDFRVTYAEKCYDFITKHANDTSINKWFSKNEFLTIDERLNNAVLIYRFLSAGGGGGGTHTTKKKSMPVWMMIKYHY